MTNTTDTTNTEIRFAEEVDARAAVRLNRESGRKADWKRVKDETGNRSHYYIVTVTTNTTTD
jgi:hypothetical protein